MRGYKTNIFIFNKEGERKKVKDCYLLRNFLFHRIDFFLTEDDYFYYVCVNDEKQDLISIWSRSKVNEGINITSNEIMSLYRKEFDKNNITKELIEKFIKAPLKHTLLKIKKKRR
jgi:hypothetical protein